MATGGQRQVFDSLSCVLCNDFDNMDMVQCDTCDQWYHHECVGVSESVANRSWSCERCISLQNANEELENLLKKPNTPETFSYVSSKASRRTTIARQRAVAFEKLEQEQAYKLDILDRKYRILESTLSDRVSTVPDGQSSMDYTLHWANEVQGVSNQLARMSFRDDVSISLSDRDREIVNRCTGQELKQGVVRKAKLTFAKVPERFMEQPVLMSEAMSQRAKSDVKAEAINKFKLGDLERVYSQLRSVIDASADPKLPLIPEVQHTRNPNVLESREQKIKFLPGQAGGQRGSRWSMDGNFGHESTPVHHSRTASFDGNVSNIGNGQQPPAPGSHSLPVPPPLMDSFNLGHAPLVQSTFGAQASSQSGIRKSGYKSRDPSVQLTSTQIASRHVFKELPEFHGRAVDWLIYLSSLKNSTEACGYTDGENLGRLQRSLKGEAKELVKSRLLHAETVPGVVETLHMMFGRPGVIIQDLLDKIDKTSPPKPDDLKSLIKFSILVQIHVAQSRRLVNWNIYGIQT